MKIPHGTQMWINSIQVLYHVRYLKLNTYLKNYNSDILTYMNIYEYMSYIYMNTCQTYIWYEKQGKVLFVIQCQCNVSGNSPLKSINTNSTLWASSSSLTLTPKEMTSDVILKSGMKADTTSCREKLLKNFIYNAFVWKYPSWHIKKNERCVKDIYKNIILSHLHIYRCIHTSNRYTFYVIKKAK